MFSVTLSLLLFKENESRRRLERKNERVHFVLHSVSTTFIPILLLTVTTYIPRGSFFVVVPGDTTVCCSRRTPSNEYILTMLPGLFVLI